MNQDAAPGSPRPVERLFPFVLKTRSLVAGRDALRAHKGKLHFVLITTDIAEAHREEVLKDFRHYPVVQHFTAADLDTFFKVKGAKAVGFMKSQLAQSIYAELKAHRINKPFLRPVAPEPMPARTSPPPRERSQPRGHRDDPHAL
ncbi:MAG: hypothetical protein ABSH48_02750 [Verrucomicrobiota bacterium]|jgi:hypothetical protein